MIQSLRCERLAIHCGGNSAFPAGALLYFEGGTFMAINVKRENMGVVFTPRDEEVYSNTSGVLYPRVIELHHAGELNGMLLATFDHSTIQEPPVVPVMCSKDHGVTWEKYSQIEDTQNGYGIRFQPHIYELPQDCGDLPAGTIVMSGNSVPLSFATTELSFISAAITARRGSSAPPSCRAVRPLSRISMRSDPCGSRISTWMPTAGSSSRLRTSVRIPIPDSTKRLRSSPRKTAARRGATSDTPSPYPTGRCAPACPSSRAGQRQVYHGLRDRRLSELRYLL